MSQTGDDEVIQLDIAAVEHLIPPYANHDDAYAALDKCGMRCSEIYRELDRETSHMNDVPLKIAAHLIRGILFRRFNSELLKVVSHKAPRNW